MTDPLITRRDYTVPGGTLSAVHFGRLSNPVKLVFLNANGFNAYAYRSVLAPLGVHAVAIDLRGHGKTSLPTDVEALTNWHIFRDDITAFFDRYMDRPVVLAGHSYGAVTAILCAKALEGRLSGYVGFDPVIMPSFMRVGSRFRMFREALKKRLPIAAGAGRRRAVFESQDAAFERLKGRGAFRGFTDDALHDYLTGGLRPHEDGVQLSCDPKWEQAIFVAQGHSVYETLPALPANSTIICAGKSPVTNRLSRAKVQKHLRGGHVILEPEFRHMFPMQDPAYATRAIKTVLQQAALRSTP